MRGLGKEGEASQETCSLLGGSPLPPPLLSPPSHVKIQFHKHSVNFTNIQLILNIAHLCISVNQGKSTREQSQNNTNIKKSLIVQLKGKMSHHQAQQPLVYLSKSLFLGTINLRQIRTGASPLLSSPDGYIGRSPLVLIPRLQQA